MEIAIRRMRWLLIAMVIATQIAAASGAPARDRLSIADRGAAVSFPDFLTFNARVTSTSRIARVILDYGVEKQTCGLVSAEAFPQIGTGQPADVSWTWDMRESGSEPPGAVIWYRWQVTDDAGHTAVSPRYRVLWLDHTHAWRSIGGGRLTLHWYVGSPVFAHTLLDSALSSLGRLGRETGVTLQAPTNMYVYASSQDLLNAVLYEPSWTGGLAFPDYNIVLIGISPDELSWGERAEAHELTHVLVGHLAFSCLANMPTWLNEGIAVYGEGGLDALAQSQLNDAIARNALLSIHALSGEFSEVRDRADLSYSESYSLVNYLIRSFGRARLHRLLLDLRQGMRIDDALNGIYGFGLDGLEARWPRAIGARATTLATPTATPVPTAIPSYPPLDGVAPTTSQHIAAPRRRPHATPASAMGPPIAAMIGTGVLIVVVLLAGYAATRRRRES